MTFVSGNTMKLKLKLNYKMFVLFMAFFIFPYSSFSYHYAILSEKNVDSYILFYDEDGDHHIDLCTDKNRNSITAEIIFPHPQNDEDFSCQTISTVSFKDFTSSILSNIYWKMAKNAGTSTLLSATIGALVGHYGFNAFLPGLIVGSIVPSGLFMTGLLGTYGLHYYNISSDLLDSIFFNMPSIFTHSLIPLSGTFNLDKNDHDLIQFLNQFDYFYFRQEDDQIIENQKFNLKSDSINLKNLSDQLLDFFNTELNLIGRLQYENYPYSVKNIYTKIDSFLKYFILRTVEEGLNKSESFFQKILLKTQYLREKLIPLNLYGSEKEQALSETAELEKEVLSLIELLKNSKLNPEDLCDFLEEKIIELRDKYRVN